jgi:hypothetical protein
MSTFSTAFTAVQTVVVSLLIDRRAQAAVAMTVALVASVLLGTPDVEAARGIISGSPWRP